ncbi:MAG: penicillin-binding protein activator LpoB [Bacteroidales bacterium]|nr:penicillin-binding protein activator LpoB [Bacteroidales bacterium]MCF8386242.1 penicillin-binding protein activator LpoB [Bacteroidales bacterium]MCF8397495.1 penicillin-binding protein activator LpoB [Bacteroidales bacterium]
MKRMIRFSVLAALILTMLASCSNRKVTRVSPDQQIDLSGRWNDTDSKQAAETMISQALSERWLDNFRQKEGRKPVVIVGLVLNKSHEHISAETFIKDLERAFINSGMVRLVQAGEMREQLRAERADQQDFASPATMKKWGQELGADFMLQGTINSIVDSYKKEKVVYYQINLELSNLETNEIVWIGDKKIKKYIEN